MRINVKDLPEFYRNQTAGSAANVEPASGNALLAEKKNARFTSPVDIHFHCIRNRLADIDGLSGKAVIDALVRGGILEDDSPEYVRQVSFTQEKGTEEYTIVRITVASCSNP